MSPKSALLLLALLLPATGAGRLRAEERYYLLMFSYQSTPNRPEHAHSFATFVKTTACIVEGREVRDLEYHTISWLPVDSTVELYRLLPEQGNNFTLHETLEIAREGCRRVSLWGPFEIEKRLHDRSLLQLRKLESGRLHYKAIDSAFPTFLVSNCIHALSDLSAFPPRLRVGTASYGDAASYRILHAFSRWLVEPSATHDWLLTALGIEDYPLVRRDIRGWKQVFPRWKE